MPSPLKHVTAALPVPVAAKLAELAEAHGYSTHAFLVRTLTRIAERMPKPTERPARHDANAEKLPETLTIEISLDLAMRLHAAARQLRDASGKPTPPTTLARQLLIHECQETTNIVDEMNRQLDPDYVDIVPFTSRMTKPRGRYMQCWHPLVIHCTFETRQAVVAAAHHHECTITDLVRGILHRHLPELPK